MAVRLSDINLNGFNFTNSVAFTSSQRSNAFKLYDAYDGSYIEIKKQTKPVAKDRFESRVREEEKRQRLERRRQKEIQRKKAFRRRVALGLATLSAFGTMVAYSLNNDKRTSETTAPSSIVQTTPDFQEVEIQVNPLDEVLAAAVDVVWTDGVELNDIVDAVDILAELASRVTASALTVVGVPNKFIPLNSVVLYSR